MKNINEIILASAEYLIDVSVIVDSSFSTISIQDDNGFLDTIFLQGYQADEIIDAAKELYETAGDVTLHDCYLHIVKGYIECIWG